MYRVTQIDTWERCFIVHQTCVIKFFGWQLCNEMMTGAYSRCWSHCSAGRTSMSLVKPTGPFDGPKLKKQSTLDEYMAPPSFTTNPSLRGSRDLHQRRYSPELFPSKTIEVSHTVTLCPYLSSSFWRFRTAGTSKVVVSTTGSDLRSLKRDSATFWQMN